jgi:hypothetical protein
LDAYNHKGAGSISIGPSRNCNIIADVKLWLKDISDELMNQLAEMMTEAYNRVSPRKIMSEIVAGISDGEGEQFILGIGIQPYVVVNHVDNDIKASLRPEVQEGLKKASGPPGGNPVDANWQHVYLYQRPAFSPDKSSVRNHYVNGNCNFRGPTVLFQEPEVITPWQPHIVRAQLYDPHVKSVARSCVGSLVVETPTRMLVAGEGDKSLCISALDSMQKIDDHLHQDAVRKSPLPCSTQSHGNRSRFHWQRRCKGATGVW